jgi:hypothetical protein
MLHESNISDFHTIQPENASGSHSHLAFLETKLDAIISLTLFRERRSLSP